MKNKFLLGLFVAFFTMSMTAQNYSFFENDIRIAENVETITLTHFGEFQLTENFGITDYVSVENNQLGNSGGQLLLGVYCKAIPNVTTSLFIGKSTLTNQTRLAGYVNYTTGDKLVAYGFYQRDVNWKNHWYDLNFRYAPYSTKSNSVYIGARYMRYYGIGMPIGVRQSLGDKGNAYLSYTTYYDCTVKGTTSDSDSARWIPTISLNLELF